MRCKRAIGTQVQITPNFYGPPSTAVHITIKDFGLFTRHSLRLNVSVRFRDFWSGHRKQPQVMAQWDSVATVLVATSPTPKSGFEPDPTAKVGDNSSRSRQFLTSDCKAPILATGYQTEGQPDAV